MDDGREPIDDAQLAVALRAQGRRLHVSAVVTAFLLTALAYLLPL